MPAPNISTIRIAVDCPLTVVTPGLDEHVGEAAGDDVGDADDEQRHERHERRAVDRQQQQDSTAHVTSSSVSSIVLTASERSASKPTSPVT